LSSLFSRGLCSVFRSRGGDPEVIRKALKKARVDVSDDDDDYDDIQDVPPAFQDSGSRFISPDPAAQNHNVHWSMTTSSRPTLSPPRHVAYYDAASLYPSSGEPSLSFCSCSFFPYPFSPETASAYAASAA